MNITTPQLTYEVASIKLYIPEDCMEFLHGEWDKSHQYRWQQSRDLTEIECRLIRVHGGTNILRCTAEEYPGIVEAIGQLAVRIKTELAKRNPNNNNISLSTTSLKGVYNLV
jgi:hypothetical protein